MNPEVSSELRQQAHEFVTNLDCTTNFRKREMELGAGRSICVGRWVEHG